MIHKFTNVTNGVTPRRWLASSNTALSEVITDYIGSDWITDMSKLGLEDGLDDSNLLEQISNTKTLGKHKLSQYIQKTLGVSVDPSSMFDVQVKRIHDTNASISLLYGWFLGMCISKIIKTITLYLAQ